MAVVLLVEDEEQVRVLAESYLEEQGHHVLSAGTPQGAIALLEKAPHIDLLFTDIDLKGDIAAGINLARDAQPRLPHLKVLYTSGQDLTDGMKAQFVEKSACRSLTPWKNCSRHCPCISRSVRSRAAREAAYRYMLPKLGAAG